MSAVSNLAAATAFWLLTFTSVGAYAAGTPHPTELVDKAEMTLWGTTLYSDFEMTINTTSWSRKLLLKVWMDRPGKSFLRVVGPAKDKGISSLRLKSEMWNYIPAIERTIKIPPSLMLQPWLGSDFTNDDLVKESSIVNDYTHKLLGDTKVDGRNAYRVEALPKPGAAVVWGKIIYTVRDDYVPLKLEFFDERGNQIRTLTYTDIRELGGRIVPTRWEMKPANEPGKQTTIVLKTAKYDSEMDQSIFSLRNLTRKD
jgi:outer membrane lipoprotein-sorting protein